MTQQKLPAKTKLTVTLGVMGRLLKKVPRIAFFMIAFYAIFWVGTQLYYRFAPSENFYDVKANSVYCYAHKTDGRISHYTYSSALIDFIVSQIKKDPNGVIDALKPKSKPR